MGFPISCAMREGPVKSRWRAGTTNTTTTEPPGNLNKNNSRPCNDGERERERKENFWLFCFIPRCCIIIKRRLIELMVPLRGDDDAIASIEIITRAACRKGERIIFDLDNFVTETSVNEFSPTWTARIAKTGKKKEEEEEHSGAEIPVFRPALCIISPVCVL